MLDAPKNGAINRAAAISVPSVAIPTLKTRSSSGGRELLLVGREVGLPGAAVRAEPITGNVVEGRAGRDSAVGVALSGIVDEPARLADPLLNGSRRHGPHTHISTVVVTMGHE